MGKKIDDYNKDLEISRDDKLIGSEQSTGKTYNYRIGSVLDLLNTVFSKILLTFEFRNDGTNVESSSGVMTTDSDAMSAVTEINFNRYNQEGEDIRPFLDAVDNNLSTVSAYLVMVNSESNEDFVRVKVDSIADNTTHYTLSVSVVGTFASGSLTNESIYFSSFDFSQSSSASKWEELTNTPSSLSGQAGKFPVVKGDETGIELTEISTSGYVTITWEDLVASISREVGDLYNIQGSNDPANDYGKVTLTSENHFEYTDSITGLTAQVKII